MFHRRPTLIQRGPEYRYKTIGFQVVITVCKFFNMFLSFCWSQLRQSGISFSNAEPSDTVNNVSRKFPLNAF